MFSLLEPIPQVFYQRDTRIVAIELIGKYLVHQIDDHFIVGKIVETEAYLGKIDPASHAYSKNSNRVKFFNQPAGMSYVYLNYGIHHCLNVITDPSDIRGAVLFRAVEPINEITFMQKNRGNVSIRELTNGPAKLTQAFQITMSHNAIPLYTGNVTIRQDNQPINYSSIGVSSRIGISKASDWKLRYFMINNPFVSGRKNLPFVPLNNISTLPDISFHYKQN